ncbi:DUF4007 family protein [Burkholderia pseudomallei]|uniref:DUF4007 family protein n=1 Tax=Burkholderia pseudomallei TaxID=28450 RepID=UPI000531BC7D|nr:DUF4007 family protein [Burkholderia pseudomallei]KGR99713.1 hypothetical protein X977_4906 [Burkholderia pseudomallei MSHR7504]KIX65837.1 hypothetical protein SZ30_21475 [Burkholderia pseudomallei]OMW57738.1 hypothetical protein AQ810_07295 [Burkholderia pseudomallei]
MTITDRFSGHESFVCRYGWLPKAYQAVSTDPDLLRDEERAMHTLGIGRNMVRSIQFWCEATGVLLPMSGQGHCPGAIGRKLLDPADGWDPHLESLESLWLLHWRLCTSAALAAWSVVFGDGRLMRFDRQRLIAALAERAEGAARPLAASTLEQHASIFLQTYYQPERSGDDTSWCPLQDLSLLRATKEEDGRVVFNTDLRAPVGLSLRVFAIALVEYVAAGEGGSSSVDFQRLLKGANSPGVVFRLDEHQLRTFVENLAQGPLHGALRFVDTSDTQSVVLERNQVDQLYLLTADQETSAHV